MELNSSCKGSDPQEGCTDQIPDAVISYIFSHGSAEKFLVYSGGNSDDISMDEAGTVSLPAGGKAVSGL